MLLHGGVFHFACATFRVAAFTDSYSLFFFSKEQYFCCVSLDKLEGSWYNEFKVKFVF